MSKFIKLVVHLIIISMIVCVLALAVPPAMGIKTTVIDDSYTDTNMLKGSVTYSREVEPTELKLGDDIVVTEDNSARRYTVIQVDLTNQTCLVKDAALKEDITQTISISEGAYKTLFAVEYIGYLLIATQTKEGMMILGIAVLVLIILYVIAELWKKDSYDEAEENYELYAELKSPKELKREEKRTEAIRKAEEKQMLKEDKQEKKDKKRRKKGKKKAKVNETVRTGGFIDEIDAKDEEKAAEQKKQPVITQQQAAASEAHAELKKEIAAATADVIQKEEFFEGIVENNLVHDTEERIFEEVEEVKEIAIPIYTAEELAKKAKDSGEEPEVMKDDASDVVLFDYSDVILEEK